MPHFWGWISVKNYSIYNYPFIYIYTLYPFINNLGVHQVTGILIKIVWGPRDKSRGLNSPLFTSVISHPANMAVWFMQCGHFFHFLSPKPMFTNDSSTCHSDIPWASRKIAATKNCDNHLRWCSNFHLFGIPSYKKSAINGSKKPSSSTLSLSRHRIFEFPPHPLCASNSSELFVTGFIAVIST